MTRGSGGLSRQGSLVHRLPSDDPAGSGLRSAWLRSMGQGAWGKGQGARGRPHGGEACHGVQHHRSSQPFPFHPNYSPSVTAPPPHPRIPRSNAPLFTSGLCMAFTRDRTPLSSQAKACTPTDAHSATRGGFSHYSTTNEEPRTKNHALRSISPEAIRPPFRRTGILAIPPQGSPIGHPLEYRLQPDCKEPSPCLIHPLTGRPCSTARPSRRKSPHPAGSGRLGVYSSHVHPFPLTPLMQMPMQTSRTPRPRPAVPPRRIAGRSIACASWGLLIACAALTSCQQLTTKGTSSSTNANPNTNTSPGPSPSRLRPGTHEARISAPIAWDLRHRTKDCAEQPFQFTPGGVPRGAIWIAIGNSGGTDVK